MRKIISKSLRRLGFELIRSEVLQQKDSQIISMRKSFDKILYLIKNNQALTAFSLGDFFRKSAFNIAQSNSQIFQDLFVLYCLNYMRNGFFVEFGAADGINLSNSYLLENSFSWKGILAEPGRVWQGNLNTNRNCIIDNRCVWTSSSKKLLFREGKIPELSKLINTTDEKEELGNCMSENTYTVETISLNDLLEVHNAPRHINYISIDTEGTEFDILSAFNFEKYSIDVLTIEHNFSEQRDKIFSLLTSKGFVRVFQEISLFDDWYVNQRIVSS